jgi:hypothetical protein
MQSLFYIGILITINAYKIISSLDITMRKSLVLRTQHTEKNSPQVSCAEKRKNVPRHCIK